MSERGKIECPWAKSDMTPCILKDGELARADDGVCVGCACHVPQFRSSAERRRYAFQMRDRYERSGAVEQEMAEEELHRGSPHAWERDPND